MLYQISAHALRVVPPLRSRRFCVQRREQLSRLLWMPPVHHRYKYINGTEGRALRSGWPRPTTSKKKTFLFHVHLINDNLVHPVKSSIVSIIDISTTHSLPTMNVGAFSLPPWRCLRARVLS
ncbi:hypothetical protein L210DRAFT_2523362 [Boletus edulis BED1]|uniref:Uncharacterized protein n=1 Tax=Boletus edulis BED1 TaxID=1328754 RepID=A0AAD4BNQ8_BOLED|nr:hypothetical protein L210DRAFT_2523362 [Boletus edulis BED1]